MDSLYNLENVKEMSTRPSNTYRMLFPEDKVKDLSLQQNSLPTLVSFLQETPMKPSQPIMRSPVAPCQDIQRKRTHSSENLTPARDLNHSSQKGRWEYKDKAKKLCLQSENFGKVQTTKPTFGSSVSTSLASQPSSGHSSARVLSPKTRAGHRILDPPHGQSNTFKPTQSSCASLSLFSHIKKQPSNGARQAYVKSTQGKTLKISLFRLSSNSDEYSVKKSMETNKEDKSKDSQTDTGNSSHFQSGGHNSGHTQHNISGLPAKTLSRNNQIEESKKSVSITPKTVSKPNSGSLSCHMAKQKKPARSRRPVIIPDNIDELFMPDPMTYVIIPAHKTAKPKISKEMIKSNNPETTPSSGQIKSEGVKSDEKQMPPFPNNANTLKTDIIDHPKTFTSHCSKPPLQDKQINERAKKQMNEEDPLDLELDLDLSFALDLDLDQTQSSHSSEEEQLLSLQEMMERATKPPDTPEKGTVSEPSTPGHHSCPSKTQPLPTATKTGIYKNNLDQMLKEINTNKRAKEIERELLTVCKKDLLRIAEYEKAEENQEEAINTEHQEFLQRYSLTSSAIQDVPPGEVVFNLEKFGRLFNRDTLHLKECMTNSQDRAQNTLLTSSPAQLKLYVNIGMFQEVYNSHLPCPARVTQFLFKMMSVHNERLVSEKILQALRDIACTAASQIVKNGSQRFKVWVPSLADVSLVLMNMGAAFVTLFPFEHLQPPFTEGDLLEDMKIKSESPSNNEQNTFPEHNYNNILKYLSYCMAICPRAYTDDELLLLLTVVGKVGLDPRLILQSSVEVYPLQYKIMCIIRDWNSMMPKICQALTDLTDDHHNMCTLVQLLPDNTRGKLLRRHLSLSMISKLLDGNCTYRPTEKEIQLSELRPYIPRMQPSTLLQGMLNSSSRSQKDKEDMAILDQQSYYLCYSLLILTNEASNIQFFPAHEKEELLFLCSELEMHVKSDIRENEKCLYRSKVKDLVARIHTKWQILLQRTKPLNGKLYDYWEPSLVDTLTSSQEEQEMENSDNGEEPIDGGE